MPAPAMTKKGDLPGLSSQACVISETAVARSISRVRASPFENGTTVIIRQLSRGGKSVISIAGFYERGCQEKTLLLSAGGPCLPYMVFRLSRISIRGCPGSRAFGDPGEYHDWGKVVGFLSFTSCTLQSFTPRPPCQRSRPQGMLAGYN